MSGDPSMRSVLIIAGSDSSGGAGIQADIKTIAAHHLFAQSALTALTAQNTLGVRDIFDIPPEFVSEQIDAVFEDIRPDAVKIGMVSSVAIVEAIARSLQQWDARNIVLDPVMLATSGSELAKDGTVRALSEVLIPLADVITPNVMEAEVLSGRVISDEIEQEAAAHAIAERWGIAALVKGGHGRSDANDVLAFPQEEVLWFRGSRIENPNTHGTGCTLSSAIACGLAVGRTIPESIGDAKTYLTHALEAQLDLGRGSGPLDHLWML